MTNNKFIPLSAYLPIIKELEQTKDKKRAKELLALYQQKCPGNNFIDKNQAIKHFWFNYHVINGLDLDYI